MLKWSLSAQKLAPNLLTAPLTPTTPAASTTTTTTINERIQHLKLCRTHGDITANKENIPVVNSITLKPWSRRRNLGRVHSNLTDVKVDKFKLKRRHSIDSTAIQQNKRYASTLPSFAEDYSPSTVLPTGQELALRGLLPDPFAFNDRYLKTTEIISDKCQQQYDENYTIKRRKLEMEFNALAGEGNSNLNLNTSNMNSTKMDDETLDQLIDAILDSARREVKKKRRSRRSLNLKRRQTTELSKHSSILSPSYTAADDPASDLSFTNYKESSDNSTKPNETKKNFNTTPSETRNGSGIDLTLTEAPIESIKQLQTGTNAKRKSNETTKSENYLEVGVALPSIYV